jgi:GH18 family chitinase
MARRGGVMLILLLGGFDVFMTAEDFIEWTNNAKTRENFLTEVLGVVEKFNLQGVLFQWYYPGCPQGKKIQVFHAFYLKFSHISRFTNAEEKLLSVLFFVTTQIQFKLVGGDL